MSRNKRPGTLASRLAKLSLGAFLGLYLSAPAYAFTPSDSPLLSAGSVAPNVILLVDDSGSMNNLIWPAGYDPTVTTRPQVYNCYSYSNCNTVVALDMTSDNQFIGNFYPGPCSSNYDGFKIGTSNTVYCLKLPDPVGGGNTRIANKYLAYLITQMTGQTKDYTDGSIPNDYRVNVARNVSSALVTSNRNLRIGLATFNPPNSRDSGPGGYIARAISDLSVTSSTTQSQADANYNALLTSISGLAAIANTPLAETYYEITRYFRGMTPYYNSTPTTYTSPLQYRCQKNYGVVITDGLPTYDRTFPSNDPLGGSNLPNWDGVNNDGANPLTGDNEGDSLFLDDIAKFAYDIDMRPTGTDLAGKAWDTKQNISTYTVGFTAANQMLADTADINHGHGIYYQATDGAGLNAALSAALNDITSKAGSGGGGASSSSSLQANTLFYASSYDPTDWRGTIRAFGFGTDGSLNSTFNWTTDTTILPASTPAPTFQSWNTLTSAAITLAYGNFAPTQQTTLSLSLPLGITGSDLVEWSKGTNKTGLKTRTVLLGDVVNSRLVYASPKDRTASDSVGDTSYTAYLDAKAAATGMAARLMVNANDGFFNVIDPATGSRLYAYMPSSVINNLHYVADPAYINGTSHKFLNDGQITVADAKLNSTWNTIAIGGTGAGGKAFFAVRLYGASTSNTISALWEIKAPDTANTLNVFNDLGYAYAKPEVARLSDGRWAAFIGNGYGSTTGVAALYVVDMRDGSLITKITADSTGNNGLSSVKLRVNAQSVVQYAYGGDLKGQMWKFNLTDPVPANWGVAFSGAPLFTALNTTAQPITAQPVIANLPGQGKLIYFGTGKLSETADKTSTARQAFYAVLDNDGSSASYTESNLVAQTINAPATGTTFFTSSQNTVDYTTKKGFYFSLVINSVLTGERVLYPGILSFGRLFFQTAIVDTTDPCSSAGSGRFMDVDAVTGAMLTYPVLDTNGDRKVNASDQTISGFTVTGSVPNISAPLANPDGSQVLPPLSGGQTELGGVNNRRIMWRQLQ